MKDEMTTLEYIEYGLGKMNWWDKVFIVLYLIGFGTVGVLMSTDLILYPESIVDLLQSLFESEGKYTAYIISFIIISISNVTLLVLFMSNDTGAYKLIRYGIDHSYQNDSSIETLYGSILSFLISLIINIVLFPMFAVIYALIAIIFVVWWLRYQS